MGCIDWCELVRDIIEIMIMEIIVFNVEWSCEILWTMVHLWDRVNPCCVVKNCETVVTGGLSVLRHLSCEELCSGVVMRNCGLSVGSRAQSLARGFSPLCGTRPSSSSHKRYQTDF